MGCIVDKRKHNSSFQPGECRTLSSTRYCTALSYLVRALSLELQFHALPLAVVGLNFSLPVYLWIQTSRTGQTQLLSKWRHRHVNASWLCAKLKFPVHHFLSCLELELIQTQMTQKPMLRAEVCARALRASQNLV